MSGMGEWLDNIEPIDDRERRELVRWVVNNDGPQPVPEANEKELVIAYEHRLYAERRRHEALVLACRACRAWHIAEQESIGTHQARMELCSLSEHLVRRALGDDVDEPYAGVPYIAMLPGPGVERVVPDEAQAWALVEELEQLKGATT